MSISDLETVEEIQRKLEKRISFGQYLLKCWIKVEEYSEKLGGNFENFWENFCGTWVN